LLHEAIVLQLLFEVLKIPVRRQITLGPHVLQVSQGFFYIAIGLEQEIIEELHQVRLACQTLNTLGVPAGVSILH
jgi:hypothetical protein